MQIEKKVFSKLFNSKTNLSKKVDLAFRESELDEAGADFRNEICIEQDTLKTDASGITGTVDFNNAYCRKNNAKHCIEIVCPQYESVFLSRDRQNR